MFQYFLARLSYSTYQCKCSFNEYRFHAINKALRTYGCDTWSCPSPSPPSWPGWAWQCSWRSPSFSQRQNLCCLTFWCDFLKVYSRLEGYFISVCQYFSLYFVTDARTQPKRERIKIFQSSSAPAPPICTLICKFCRIVWIFFGDLLWKCWKFH